MPCWFKHTVVATTCVPAPHPCSHMAVWHTGKSHAMATTGPSLRTVRGTVRMERQLCGSSSEDELQFCDRAGKGTAKAMLRPISCSPELTRCTSHAGAVELSVWVVCSWGGFAAASPDAALTYCFVAPVALLLRECHDRQLLSTGRAC